MRFLLFFLAALIATPAMAQPAQHAHLDWTRNATIYEVNIRQFSREGTINAFARDLPRIAKMGVKILWIMPVQPIGVKERKGSLGSYYAIRDYTAVNPEFGTQADFNAMVRTAHKLGMKVILDWVANHTAWDHDWARAHPDWYKKNKAGEIGSYEYDNGREVEYWTDVIGLDYRQPALWDEMIAAMRHWVEVGDVDGFRCDVASLVPIPFWQRARAELEKTKPLFMLAESNDPAIHVAFDMSYDWKLWDAFEAIARGKGDARTLRSWLAARDQGFPADAYRMAFTSNHDINSWRTSDADLFGARFAAFAVLAATLPDMPLIYNGQESGLTRKIAFFERDPIDWGRYANAALYTRLLALKARHAALRNGAQGGPVVEIETGDDHVFAFSRRQGSDQVRVAVNLSDTARSVAGLGEKPVRLAPWGYVIRER